MTQTVTVGNITHNFPDEATPEMIAGALGVKPPEQGFLDRLSADSQNRSEQSQAATDRYAAGEQSFPRSVAQKIMLGTVGPVVDTAAEGLTSAYKNLVPQFAQNDISKVGGLIGQGMGAIGRGIMASPAGDALKSGAQEAAQLAKDNPGRVADLESIGVGLQALPVGKVLSVGARELPGAVSAVSNKLYDAGKTAFDARRLNAVQQLIMPKQTAGEIADTALQRSNSGGLFNKQVYTPNPYESDMIKTASDAGVKPNAPLEENIHILNNAKNSEAENLKIILEKANVPIDSNTLNQSGVTIAQQIAKNPLVQENSSTVDKILKVAQDAIDNNPKTAAGVLQARKDFDRAIGEFQPSAFDTDAPATAFRYATKQVRQGFNDVVSNAVPDVAVKESLAKQSHMYQAIDNMSGKLSQQPNGRFPRFFDSKTGQALKTGAKVTGLTAAGGYAINRLTPQVQESYSGDGQ